MRSRKIQVKLANGRTLDTMSHLVREKSRTVEVDTQAGTRVFSKWYATVVDRRKWG